MNVKHPRKAVQMTEEEYHRILKAIDTDYEDYEIDYTNAFDKDGGRIL